MKSYKEKNVKKKIWGYEGRRKVEVISFDYPIYMNGNRELGLTKVHTYKSTLTKVHTKSPLLWISIQEIHSNHFFHLDYLLNADYRPCTELMGKDN